MDTHRSVSTVWWVWLSNLNWYSKKCSMIRKYRNWFCVSAMAVCCFAINGTCECVRVCLFYIWYSFYFSFFFRHCCRHHHHHEVIKIDFVLLLLRWRKNLFEMKPHLLKCEFEAQFIIEIIPFHLLPLQRACARSRTITPSNLA